MIIKHQVPDVEAVCWSCGLTNTKEEDRTGQVMRWAKKHARTRHPDGCARGWVHHDVRVTESRDTLLLNR